MARSKRKKTSNWPGWDCVVCMRMFTGGKRCAEHNPTPEEREAHPERYVSGTFARSIKTIHPEDN